MSLTSLAKGIFTWTAILLGFFSAYYWYKASVAKVSKDTSEHPPGVEMEIDDPADPNKSMLFVASAIEQSRLNRVAATYTALALLCQAIASAFPSG